ncbi:hypothetical protein A9K55_008475 [Cordyceps militaris]|uniref:Uncharacterized protein n=1 Tax=Cordyceps militaris TaxID=73501 RepID=A0A2H4SIR2_CORMI|nr:hypothetical protein A9K55_008475 [Cordyceps militaris]
MPRLAKIAALFAALAPAIASLTDGQYTETIGAQEVGSTTIDGTMVYSMNHCSIVHSTQCYTSLSTGGPAAPGYSSSSASPPTPPAPTYGSSSSSGGASVPVPTASSTVEHPLPSTTTVVGSTSVPSSEATTSIGHSSSTTQTPDVPTGAAAMGASAVIGNVFAAALAALVV